MIEIIVGILLGIIITLVFLYVYWSLKTPKQITIDDPTDDEEYLEIVRQLKCPDCGSTDYRFSEVSDLKWIQGEDRYCICNRCGRNFSDGK